MQKDINKITKFLSNYLEIDYEFLKNNIAIFNETKNSINLLINDKKIINVEIILSTSDFSKQSLEGVINFFNNRKKLKDIDSYIQINILKEETEKESLTVQNVRIDIVGKEYLKDI